MKPVFIIAIVAVAMIGVMIPSVFAEKEITIFIESIQDTYLHGESIILNIDVEKYVPNTPIMCNLKNPEGQGFSSAGGQQYLNENKLDIEYNLSFSQQNTDWKENSKILTSTINARVNLFKGIQEVICYYGEPANYLGKSTTIIDFTDKLNPSVEFVLQNHIVDKFDVGTDIINDMYFEYKNNCSSNFCITHTIFDSERRQDITTYYYNQPPEEYVGKKIIENVSVDLKWGSVFDGCSENYPSHCLVFNTLVKKIKKTGFPSDNTKIKSYITFPLEFTQSVKSESCGTGTESINGICQVIQTKEPEPTSNSESKGGGCLIATATYGSEMATEVQQLRELRDSTLLNTESGTQFMGMFNDIYYSFSPIIADYERENPLFKEAVKLAITPMISTLSLMENANSESEVLSIGISVIMLNLGMYLGVPAVVIVGIRKIK
jgi:hypothetical protein